MAHNRACEHFRSSFYDIYAIVGDTFSLHTLMQKGFAYLNRFEMVGFENEKKTRLECVYYHCCQ